MNLLIAVCALILVAGFWLVWRASLAMYDIFDQRVGDTAAVAAMACVWILFFALCFYFSPGEEIIYRGQYFISM